MMERTLIIIKPDAVKRGLVGEILSRFEKRGFNIIKLEMMNLSMEKARSLYSVHINKPFFKNLIEFITSGPVVPVLIEGVNACEEARRMIGPTNPANASSGTIRGDFASSITENVIHASDSPETFLREEKVIFGQSG